MASTSRHFRSLHQFGHQASLSSDTYLDRLFACTLKDAIEIVKTAPENYQDDLWRAVIAWNGFAENEVQARKARRGSAYFNAILDAHKLLAPLYTDAEFPTENIESISYPIPTTDPEKESPAKSIEIMCEVTLPAHAPTATAESSLLAA